MILAFGKNVANISIVADHLNILSFFQWQSADIKEQLWVF